MRVLLTTLAITCFAASASASDDCNIVTLAKCFIEVLDDWAWALFEVRDNIITANDTQCSRVENITHCIDEAEKEGCTTNQIIEVSNTVTDLVTFKKRGGSFLRSYYVLLFACSPEGREIVNRNQECLRTEEIGKQTLLAAEFLHTLFVKHDQEQVDLIEMCNESRTKIQSYTSSIENLCPPKEASRFMCNTLTKMLHSMHPFMQDSCGLTCPEPEIVSVESPTETVEGAQGQQGTKAAAHIFASTIAAFVFAVALRH